MDSIFIGEQDRSICVGWGALKEFGKLTGRPFEKVFSLDGLDFDDIEKLLFVSLKWGAKGDIDFKLKDVQGWLNDDMSIIVPFMELFAEQTTAALSKNQEAPATGQ